LCGIAGMLGAAGADTHVLEAMAGCLHHRGPDAGGTWTEGPVGLAHRRLAVIELGEAGAQPMRSASGRHVIVYNGELYNHPDLRRELETSGGAPSWRGGSDTETLLAGIEAWGLDGLLPRTVGMFAFALWDREERRLTLVRDRMGEKPLSWALHAGTLLFASQPSALRRVPGFTPGVDPDALADLLRYAQVPGERTIHREVRHVLPGHLLEAKVDERGRVSQTPSSRPWWSFDAVARAGLADPLQVGPSEQVDLVEDAVTAAVRGQMLSDVPLGAFLSGGIDSSLVVATMQRLSSRPVRTFTIGFAEPAYDESPHARAVAAHLGTEHTELLVTPAEAQAVIPELPHVYDEPFADSSQIPTLLVSRLARRDVTVALSGDGGDELFAGYDRYARALQVARVPRPVALAAATLYALRGDRRRRSAALALGRGPAPTIRRLLSANPDAEALVPGADADANRQRFVARWDATAGLGDLRGRFMALDTTGYLPDDILHKVDRAAMAVSLETRVPLLDHRLVALAWRLPERARVRDGVGKWVLREALARHVPRALLDRPKAGFAVPIGRWLRGPLRPWAEDLLAPEALGREGLLDVAAVRRLWSAHLGSDSDDAHELWPVLMFRAWSETHRSAGSA
jgi:asparagine synthase (glutamine-hydrolysing)